MHVWALPTPTQQDRRWIKRIFSQSRGLKRRHHLRSALPNALQHKKRREPKFPPVNGMKSGGYFA